MSREAKLDRFRSPHEDIEFPFNPFPEPEAEEPKQDNVITQIPDQDGGIKSRAFIAIRIHNPDGELGGNCLLTKLLPRS